MGAGNPDLFQRHTRIGYHGSAVRAGEGRRGGRTGDSQSASTNHGPSRRSAAGAPTQATSVQVRLRYADADSDRTACFLDAPPTSTLLASRCGRYNAAKPGFGGGGVDDLTRDRLRKYLATVKTLPNESAKTHLFAGLVGELFPDSGAVAEIAAGTEKRIKIGNKLGRADAYYKNSIIEFEKSLKATETTALKQLREYTAGEWKKATDNPRPIICIASDGVVWKVLRPSIRSGAKGTLVPDDIRLEELRALSLTEKTLREFWLWLTGFLFRESQTKPTAERFALDFGARSPAFADTMAALGAAWEASKTDPESLVAFDTWKNYLAVTFGGPGVESDELFLKHSYLSSLARLLIWAALSGGKASGSLSDVVRQVLSGDYFRSEKIENLVEDDFFKWVRRAPASKLLLPIWERVLDQLRTYDLSHIGEDVLKGVYEQLVIPEDRHDLGEYYTPDWLCERIVAETLPAEGFPSVLDPSCGSGSFLRAAIAHLLKANPGGGPVARLREVLANVVGIDIHPLAVTIARATYVLALKDLLPKTARPVQIPVYLADSLFLPSEVGQQDWTRGSEYKGWGYEIKFGPKPHTKRVRIPSELVSAGELFDPAIGAAATVAAEHANSKAESIGTLRAYLTKVAPDLVSHKLGDEMIKALWGFVEGLAELIRHKRNSIWAFIVRNGYRPAMLRNHFDFVLGNPPWLAYRDIKNPDYQAEIKHRAVSEYEIAPKVQKLMTHMELATVFFAHALTTFGREGSRLAFVMPRSILSADQHEQIRLRSYKAPIETTAAWDLLDVSPVFNVPSSVLFARRMKDNERPSPRYTLDGVKWFGRLPERDLPWSEATKHLTAKPVAFRVIFLGDRSALSALKGRAKPNDPSGYMPRFRQGATIVPRNFYFVRAPTLAAPVDPDGLYHAETEPEQAKLAKPPYKGTILSGNVEGRFFFSTAISDNLVPFRVEELPTIVLPIQINRGEIEVLEAADLRKRGDRDFAKWMERAEKAWHTHRGAKAKKQSLYERLNYGKELTEQDTTSRFLVVYNTSGTNLTAAVIDRGSLPLAFVVDHKLYWMALDDRDEADYVTAILNSDFVNDAIKPFQSVGLQGERDIHKKPLELPIPLFDAKRKEHREIAELGRDARASVAGLAITDTSLAKRRETTREALCGVLGKIDGAVTKLLEAADTGFA